MGEVDLSKVVEVKTLVWYPSVSKLDFDREINELLSEGWVLVHIGESYREEGGDIVYTLVRFKR